MRSNLRASGIERGGFLRLRLILLGAALSSFTLLTSGAVSATDGGPHEGRLAEINRSVEEQTKVLDAVTKEQQQVEGELRSLTAEVRALQAKEKTLRVALQEKKVSSEKLTAELQAAERKAQALRDASRSRIRAIYMQKHESFLETILMVSDQSTLQQHAYFLARIRDYDKRLLHELEEVRINVGARSDKLQSVIEEQRRTHASLDEQQKGLAAKLRRREELAKSLRSKRSDLEQGIVKLRAEALRLETVLVSLTGQQEATAVNSALRSQHREASSERRVGEYQGPGLASRRGKLGFPVVGRVVRAAKGSEEGRSFRDMVSKKGVEFECEGEAQVKPVAPGRVIYLGRMPGLGNLIIVDHGDRYYTLYGRLSNPEVVLGSDLDESSVLGGCDVASTVPSLYFEVRKNGSAVDPKGYLKGL